MLLSLLQQYWGYTSFRPFQEEIIQAVVDQNDVLAVLPTGGGKSVCYQLPALLNPGYVVVVSPLIALMQDQVLQLQQRGIPAAAIHSGMTAGQQSEVLNDLADDEIKLLYLAPERLILPGFQEYFADHPPRFVAIDEAHCISQWGHDFRPAYRQLRFFRQQFPKLPIIAMTASATPKVLEDIKEQLGLCQPYEVKQTVVRPNLFYHIRETENKPHDLVRLFQHKRGSSILYCRSRKSCEETASYLRQHGLDAHYYHAGLSRSERERVQEIWTNSSQKIMCATNAFGMGIDKPDIDIVAHYGIPDRLESYYQEAGRAGRGGQKAHAVLLYNNQDISRLLSFSEQLFPSETFIRKVYQAVGDYLQIPLGTGMGSSQPLDVADLCHKFDLEKTSTYHAVRILEREGWWQWNQDIHSRTMVRFTTDRASLQYLERTHKALATVALGLLRLYGSIFNFLTPIRIFELARVLEIDAGLVENGLNQLSALGFIEYQPAQSGSAVHWLHDRVAAAHLNLNTEHMEELRQANRNRLAEMLDFVRNETTCRNQLLAAYFGFEIPELCGSCDVCKQTKTDLSPALKAQILQTIRTEQKISSQALCAKFTSVDQGEIINYIRVLCDEQLCSINLSGTIFST